MRFFHFTKWLSFIFILHCKRTILIKHYGIFFYHIIYINEFKTFHLFFFAKEFPHWIIFLRSQHLLCQTNFPFIILNLIFFSFKSTLLRLHYIGKCVWLFFILEGRIFIKELTNFISNEFLKLLWCKRTFRREINVWQNYFLVKNVWKFLLLRLTTAFTTF